ncbi:hypothetical protein MNBD_DELTA03-512 [hydrothermal vent metagenome]|uniref:Rhodanese domain-containing protein n=1 Tax=hydrothermal vent metagenome TaxID=652676 RepID=A0A3B0WG10_9ZZZZ
MDITKKFSTILLGFILSTSLLVGTAMAGNSPLVSVKWLANNINRSNMVILDVSDFTHYEKNHIPGAVKAFGPWMTMNHDFVGFMMPKVSDLNSMIRSYGVNNNSFIVIYAEGVTAADTAKSARALWTLQALGHNKVAILNGGFTAWERSGEAISARAATPDPGNFSGTLKKGMVVSFADVQSELHSPGVTFVDTRLPDQYFGKEKNSEVARFGHIPGSLLWPASYITNAGVNLSPSYFKDVKVLRQMAAGVGIPADKNAKIITYSNHGKSAALTYFVLHDILGYQNVSIYDGSMLQYAVTKASLNTFQWGGR